VNLCSKIYDLLVTRELELSSWAEVAMYNNWAEMIKRAGHFSSHLHIDMVMKYLNPALKGSESKYFKFKEMLNN
jgi:hypothetical protein